MDTSRISRKSRLQARARATSVDIPITARVIADCPPNWIVVRRGGPPANTRPGASSARAFVRDGLTSHPIASRPDPTRGGGVPTAAPPRASSRRTETRRATSAKYQYAGILWESTLRAWSDDRGARSLLLKSASVVPPGPRFPAGCCFRDDASSLCDGAGAFFTPRFPRLGGRGGAGSPPAACASARRPPGCRHAVVGPRFGDDGFPLDPAHVGGVRRGALGAVVRGGGAREATVRAPPPGRVRADDGAVVGARAASIRAVPGIRLVGRRRRRGRGVRVERGDEEAEGRRE